MIMNYAHYVIHYLSPLGTVSRQVRLQQWVVSHNITHCWSLPIGWRFYVSLSIALLSGASKGGVAGKHKSRPAWASGGLLKEYDG